MVGTLPAFYGSVNKITFCGMIRYTNYKVCSFILNCKYLHARHITKSFSVFLLLLYDDSETVLVEEIKAQSVK